VFAAASDAAAMAHAEEDAALAQQLADRISSHVARLHAGLDAAMAM
jgi:hypothetical protein